LLKGANKFGEKLDQFNQMQTSGFRFMLWILTIAACIILLYHNFCWIFRTCFLFWFNNCQFWIM